MEQHMDMVTTSASVSVSEEVASAVPPPPPTLHWEVQCQRVTITNDKVEILTLLRDIIRTYDTTISKLWPTATTTTATAAAAAGPEYRSFITTILPLCSHCLINKTTPTPDILSVDHQIRQLILEFIHALVQTHTTTGTGIPSTTGTGSSSAATSGTTAASTSSTGNNHSKSTSGSSFTLRPHATTIIGMMIHLIQVDYELLSVVATRIIFDLYKFYRTSISNEHIQTFLDFVIVLYRNLPFAVQHNFLKENLIQLQSDASVVMSTSITSNVAAADATATTTVVATASGTRDMNAMEVETTTVAPDTTKVSAGATANDGLGADAMEIDTTTATNNTEPATSQQEVMDIIDHSFNGVTTPSATITAAPMTTASAPSIATTPMDTTTEVATEANATTTTTTANTTLATKDMITPQSYKIAIPGSASASFPGGPLSSSSSVGSMIGTSPQANVLKATTTTSNIKSEGAAYRMVLYKSKISFQVLTECPLIVMLLMFQLHPQQFMKNNILTFIQLMMDALSLRPPSLPSKSNLAAATAVTNTPSLTSVATAGSSATATTTSVVPSTNNTDARLESTTHEQMHMIRARELIAAQAKTLSFLTYLLRTFVSELKPYEDRLADNVIALMTICPRDAISTRKELLVATRHILNSEFRTGFFKHIDAMIDERILMGGTTSITSNHRPDPTIIRPLAYTTLADFLQHARALLSMAQMNKVVCLFSRIIHDTSIKMPLTTQFTAVRTLISVIDIVYNNKDPDPQIGRDILVRLLNTMVDKLHALNEYYPEVVKAEHQRIAEESATLEQQRDQTQRTKWLFDTAMYHPTTDTAREVQSLIRTIIVSQKNMVYYLCNYRNQRVENAAAAAAAALSSSKDPTTATISPSNNRGAAVADPSVNLMPPSGSNEEVSSALLKLTHTEIAIIDRYIMVALNSMKLLSEADKTDSIKSSSGSKKSLTTSGGESNSVEKTISDLHRDSLTYFAATFTAMDGYNLRRSLGRRIDVLVDAIVDEPLTMIVPRHLLGSNATTSHEFCNLLLEYLVSRMDLLRDPTRTDIIFVEEQPTGNDVSEQKYLKATVHSIVQRPMDSIKRHRHRTATLVQLFERVLKSLAVYPGNEAIVRKHLRFIVTSCLRSSFENTSEWPESYPMLLRYVFRSISAGKFEDSYRELLPLIPTVLNGLCRVVISTEDSILRNTAIELCLTIPARLSSLLPHMNLLLRIIIPALDSNSNELINLGLRTLEFWVDNLNHLFLYPEMSKCTSLFTLLMQSLSRHLRPAPYPYGLLTLRLLGKLGGKNRQFLRDPVPQPFLVDSDTTLQISAKFKAERNENAMDDSDFYIAGELRLPLPLRSCVDMLREVAMGIALDDVADTEQDNHGIEVETIDPLSLWDIKIEDLDLQAYSSYAIHRTKEDQAIACMNVIRAALAEIHLCDAMDVEGAEKDVSCEKLVYSGLLFACMVDATSNESSKILHEHMINFDPVLFSNCFGSFMSEPSNIATKVGLGMLDFALRTNNGNDNGKADLLLDALICSLCETACACSSGRHFGLMLAIDKMILTLGVEWSRKYEVKLINAALLAVKAQPRELSEAAVRALRGFLRVCIALYGEPWDGAKESDDFVWDILSVEGGKSKGKNSDGERVTVKYRPSEDVFKIIIYEVTSSQQLVRFASRFLLQYFFCEVPQTDDNLVFIRGRIDLIRRVLFSRTLRLLPLPFQVGAIEGLATIVNFFPSLFPLTDQHVLTFLSELLKMASVADGEMTDSKLNGIVVDKDGYVPSEPSADRSLNLRQSSSLFFRRECVIALGNKLIVIPSDLPTGVQFRVSSIVLFHSIIKHNGDAFFDADSTNPIGNIRPHVVSLLFRSLVSQPLRAVNSAHFALCDVLALGSTTPVEGDELVSSNTRIPKELLQTCIRPVLLQLREYTRLSVPLLRGLGRLLLILGSWFNKTLGERLLDHLRKWTDPNVIIGHKIWAEGDEPLVAAAIIDIFSLLPFATQFVEHLVKTCIKLESTLHLFKSRFVETPYRRPLARYLNKHSQSAVGFFFPRFKTPMYSELFQYIVELDESSALRKYLSTKECSEFLLRVSFEKPLALVRSEKSSSGDSKTSLNMHGIGKQLSSGIDQNSGSLKPMNTEALEMQHQGLRLVNTLMMYDPNYFKDHSDIVRASRWLWRSRGRLVRQQYEEAVSPRFQDESKLLAMFRMNYAKSFPAEAIDIIFELFRVFLQPSTIDFGYVSRFLVKMVTEVLTIDQKKKVLSRFFASIAGDTNEEIKVLGIQFLVIPMLTSENRSIAQRLGEDAFDKIENDTNIENRLINKEVLERFISELMFQDRSPILCGSRLSVELLRLLYHFVENNMAEVGPFQNDIVQYCWGMLKSENMTCRCWSYVVLCKIISLFDTPSKRVRKIYFALLKIQEERRLVRAALDLLVPAFLQRLDDDNLQQTLTETFELMADESLPVVHLAQINQTIVRNPDVFESHSGRLVFLLMSGIHRLGLHSTGPIENRFLAVNVVELILVWADKRETEIGSFLADNADSLTNFLIRLKLLISEGPSDARNPLHFEVSICILDLRLQSLLDMVLSKFDVRLRMSPFEKLLNRERKLSGPLLACLDIIRTVLKYRYVAVLNQHASVFRDVIDAAVCQSRQDIAMQSAIRTFAFDSKASTLISSLILASLDKALLDAHSDQSKIVSSDRGSDRSRTKDRFPAANDPMDSSAFIFFCLDVIAEFCRSSSGLVNMVGSTLLTLAKSFARQHLADAAAKLRQSASTTSRASSSGIRFSTPTIGILDEASQRDKAVSSRNTKGRYRKETLPADLPIRSLVTVLSIFEEGLFVYTFSEARKSILQIVSNILDSSDNVQVIMIAVRCVGKWILSSSPGSPLTEKERASFLERICGYDLSNLSDDVTAQPLSDLIASMSLRFAVQPKIIETNEGSRLLAACILNSNSTVRGEVLQALETMINNANAVQSISQVTWSLLQIDYEGLGARFWITVFVDVLLTHFSSTQGNFLIGSLSTLSHGSTAVSLKIWESLLPWVWSTIPDDALRIRFIGAFEALLSQPYHAQFLRSRTDGKESHNLNCVRSFLATTTFLNPIPVYDTHLLIYLAENYNCWYEAVALLEAQYSVFRNEQRGEILISALRHCYRRLGDDDVWCALAKESCLLTDTKRALSLDTYDVINQAIKQYSDLMEDSESELEPSDFEMDLWEGRWIILQRELCQFQTVAAFANASDSPMLKMECAWKAKDWSNVRKICASNELFAAIESGDPLVKLSETLVAVADGKLSEVENLHAQTAQLCLYKWQLLPQISTASFSHSSLLHFFHRLVEIRESGQIMVETNNHSTGKTLPDLKNLLSAWRHRLPNEWDKLSKWDDIFAWRAHMFSAISSNLSWCDAETLASQHDQPWTALRMAKTARKQGLRDVSLLLLSKVTDEQAMNVTDAYAKLRERILALYNVEPDEQSKLERQSGLNLINTTNLSFFDSSQNSELFRLRALFLQSLQGRSKANQAFCHSVQICPEHARAWDSWGELCASLGTATEKQIEQGGSGGSGENNEANKDAIKKVRQYLAQAMGCYVEAIQIDGNEWARLRIPKCLWMLTKDGSTSGVLCQTLETRGVHLPAWVWLPWIPQLLTSLYRKEGRTVKAIFSRLVKSYPQAVYYALRTFYLERRDVDRGKATSAAAVSSSEQLQLTSVSHAEELMSLLRRSHASLWSALEPCLEELIVKFRHSYEEELLATIVVLLERTETQFGNFGKKEDEAAVATSVWKTLGKIAVKFFRQHEREPTSKDARTEKTTQFKEAYKCMFESDFQVSSYEASQTDLSGAGCPLGVDEIVEKLRNWKRRLEDHVVASPESVSLVESSHSLAMFGVGDVPDLWPGSCDTSALRLYSNERENAFDNETTTTPSTTSSSAGAARKAAKNAADAVSDAARREGVGGDYGGGSSFIEIPGQYVPNTCSWKDARPSPELHVKLLKFEPTVAILRRNDTLVRRVGMVGNDGKTYYFLLQIGVSYLARTDERSSQTLYVLDKILRRDMKSSRALLSVQSHPSIPVAQRLRLIYEPEGRTSLEDVYRDFCGKRGFHYSELISSFCDDVKKRLTEKLSTVTIEGHNFVEIEKATRLDVYNAVRSCEQCNDNMLTDHAMLTVVGAEAFYQFRGTFAQQWAANCLLQYTFSAMDRTPSKVVFDYSCGRVHSTEFRLAYTNQGILENQHVPFRLTPNIETLIGFLYLDARYTTAMTLIAGAVQQCQQDLDPIFRLLMRDDLIAYFTKSLAKSDSTTVEMEKQLAGSVARNVAMLHARFAECAPSSQGVITKQQVHVDQRVRDLMETGRDPRNLCLMPGSFQGWM